MAIVKLNISMEETVAACLRRRAAELRKPTSRYLSELVVAGERRHLDRLADEGYRLLHGDTEQFVGDTWPTALEGWPEWDNRSDEPA